MSVEILKYRLRVLNHSATNTFDVVALNNDNAHAAAEWCGGLLVTEYDPQDRDIYYYGINVPVPNGKRRASVGSLIMKDAHGRFFVSDPAVFHNNYILVTPAEQKKMDNAKDESWT